MTANVRRLRPLVETDVELLQAIDDVAHGQAWSRRTFLEEINRSDRVHLVAETDDGIVGHAAAWIDGASCRITNVAVAPAHSGSGHGTAMLVGLIGQVLTDHRVANLQLEVRPSNRRAQRMYGRFGFAPVGIERSFYDRSDDTGSTDALIMAVPDVCAEQWRDRFADLKAVSQDQPETDAGAAA